MSNNDTSYNSFLFSRTITKFGRFRARKCFIVLFMYGGIAALLAIVYFLVPVIDFFGTDFIGDYDNLHSFCYVLYIYMET